MAVPAVTSALVKGQLIQAMSNARQIHLATMSMATDGATNSDSTLGWPGDLKDNSQISVGTDFVSRLVAYDYLKAGDLKVFATAGITAYNGTGTLTGSGTSAKLSDFKDTNNAYKIYLVRDSDASNTVFLATKNYSYNTVFSTTASSLKPFGDKGFVIFRKGGDASILKKQQAQSLNLIGTLPGFPDINSPGTESATTCFITAQ